MVTEAVKPLICLQAWLFSDLDPLWLMSTHDVIGNTWFL